MVKHAVTIWWKRGIITLARYRPIWLQLPAFISFSLLSQFWTRHGLTVINASIITRKRKSEGCAICIQMTSGVAIGTGGFYSTTRKARQNSWFVFDFSFSEDISSMRLRCLRKKFSQKFEWSVVAEIISFSRHDSIFWGANITASGYSA